MSLEIEIQWVMYLTIVTHLYIYLRFFLTMNLLESFMAENFYKILGVPKSYAGPSICNSVSITVSESMPPFFIEGNLHWTTRPTLPAAERGSWGSLVRYLTRQG